MVALSQDDAAVEQVVGMSRVVLLGGCSDGEDAVRWEGVQDVAIRSHGVEGHEKLRRTGGKRWGGGGGRHVWGL